MNNQTYLAHTTDSRDDRLDYHSRKAPVDGVYLTGDMKSQFRIPYNEHRFRVPINPSYILFKSCLRCDTGDLVWEQWLKEWFCIQCGWREFETSFKNPVTGRSI